MNFILIITLLNYAENTTAITHVPGFDSEASCAAASIKFRKDVDKKKRWELLSAICVSTTLKAKTLPPIYQPSR